MQNENIFERVLKTKIGDSIELEGFRGRAESIEYLRDADGHLCHWYIVEPEEAAREKKGQAKPYLVQKKNNCRETLEVVAEVFYPNGDCGLMIRWALEYPDKQGVVKKHSVMAAFHRAIFDKENGWWIHVLRRQGLDISEQTPRCTGLIRDYLVENVPDVKALCKETWREYAAKAGVDCV